MDPALTYTVPVGWFNKFDEANGYGLLPENAANMASLNSGGFGVTTVELQRDLRRRPGGLRGGGNGTRRRHDRVGDGPRRSRPVPAS